VSRLFRILALVGSAVASAPVLGAQTKPAVTSWPATVKPVWPDEGPYKWAPRPTSAEITANDLRTRLYQIADDSMLGRRIGEPTNYKTTAYIASEFKRLGLKPAGDNGSWFQNLAYGPSAFDEAKSSLASGGAAFALKTDFIPLVPNAATGIGSKADVANVSVVFAGRWGETTALDAAAFKGKVAVYLGGPAAGAAGGRGGANPANVLRCDSVPNRFGAAAAVIADAATAAAAAGRGGRGGGAGGGTTRDNRAVAAGALAVLYVNLDGMTPAQVTAALAPRSGMETPAVTAPAAASISAGAAQKLFGKPLDQVAVGTAGEAVSASWSYAFKMSETPARNVVAVLPGSDPTLASEYVLVGAHNDHVGTLAAPVDHDSTRAVNSVTRRQGSNDPVCRPTPDQQHAIDSLIARARSIRPARRDSIMNGADDDGSGTVVLLEIAEKFAKEKPKRSIIFISHQGEESGLLGSKWFTDHPTLPLDKIVAAHNMDMVGKGRVEQVKFGGPTSLQTLGSRRLSREFGDIIDSVNAVRAETMAIDKTWEVPSNPMNRFCRSDQVNYVRKDIPVTYFSLGYAQDYHMATDEPQYIEYEHAARVGRFIHDVMFAIANRKDKPAISGADPTMPSCNR
jgi:hypothetical protein